MYLSLAFIILGSAAYASAITPMNREESAPSRLHIPICALPCATNSTSGCSLTDLQCLCANPNFVSSATSCIQSSCTGNEQQRALADAERLCLVAGATASIPVSTTTFNGIPTTLYSVNGFWTATTSPTTTTWPWLSTTTTSTSTTSTSSAAAREVVNNVLAFIVIWAVVFSFYA